MDKYVGKLIESIKWQTYEQHVLSALEHAIAKFCSLPTDANSDKISQISIGTDPYTQTTAINFETQQHALRHIQRQASYLREMKMDAAADQVAQAAFQGNPADFKFPSFYTYLHLELNALSTLDLSDYDVEQLVLQKIEVSLLHVMDNLASTSLPKNFPSEEEIWVGINSPEDWYDHVQKIVLQREH